MNLFSNLIKKINKSNSNDDQKYSSNYSSNIYHEKQVKELCALHTLNNLFILLNAILLDPKKIAIPFLSAQTTM